MFLKIVKNIYIYIIYINYKYRNEATLKEYRDSSIYITAMVILTMAF